MGSKNGEKYINDQEQDYIMGDALKVHSSAFQDLKDYSHEMSRDLDGSKVDDLMEEESKGELAGD